MCALKSTIVLYYFLRIVVNFPSVRFVNADETFESDLGENMSIGLAAGGYKSVKLKCGSNSMHVKLDTDEDFDGVIYTRGSFHQKQPRCFLDAETRREKRSFSLVFDLDECQTQRSGEVYSNVLVLQHDRELIMPGDAAFHLECDFGRLREVTLQANLSREAGKVVSRIRLTDADPSRSEKHHAQRSLDADEEVVITPDKARTLSKEEL